MHSSIVFALLSLSSGALGAFMPRRSTGAAQCFACPEENLNATPLAVSTPTSCLYNDEENSTCYYDSTTGSLTANQLPSCAPALEPVRFLCPPTVPGNGFTAEGVDDSRITCKYDTYAYSGPTYCYYDLNTGSLITADSNTGCASSTPCGQSLGRRNKAEDNFTAVQRRKEARREAPAPTTPRPAF